MPLVYFIFYLKFIFVKKTVQCTQYKYNSKINTEKNNNINIGNKIGWLYEVLFKKHQEKQN